MLLFDDAEKAQQAARTQRAAELGNVIRLFDWWGPECRSCQEGVARAASGLCDDCEQLAYLEVEGIGGTRTAPSAQPDRRRWPRPGERQRVVLDALIAAHGSVVSEAALGEHLARARHKRSGVGVDVKRLREKGWDVRPAREADPPSDSSGYFLTTEIKRSQEPNSDGGCVTAA